MARYTDDAQARRRLSAESMASTKYDATPGSMSPSLEMHDRNISQQNPFNEMNHDPTIRNHGHQTRNSPILQQLEISKAMHNPQVAHQSIIHQPARTLKEDRCVSQHLSDDQLAARQDKALFQANRQPNDESKSQSTASTALSRSQSYSDSNDAQLGQDSRLQQGRRIRTVNDGSSPENPDTAEIFIGQPSSGNISNVDGQPDDHLKPLFNTSDSEIRSPRHRSTTPSNDNAPRMPATPSQPYNTPLRKTPFLRSASHSLAPSPIVKRPLSPAGTKFPAFEEPESMTEEDLDEEIRNLGLASDDEQLQTLINIAAAKRMLQHTSVDIRRPRKPSALLLTHQDRENIHSVKEIFMRASDEATARQSAFEAQVGHQEKLLQVKDAELTDASTRVSMLQAQVEMLMMQMQENEEHRALAERESEQALEERDQLQKVLSKTQEELESRQKVIDAQSKDLELGGNQKLSLENKFDKEIMELAEQQRLLKRSAGQKSAMIVDLQQRNDSLGRELEQSRDELARAQLEQDHVLNNNVQYLQYVAQNERYLAEIHALKEQVEKQDQALRDIREEPDVVSNEGVSLFHEIGDSIDEYPDGSDSDTDVGDRSTGSASDYGASAARNEHSTQHEIVSIHVPSQEQSPLLQHPPYAVEAVDQNAADGYAPTTNYSNDHVRCVTPHDLDDSAKASSIKELDARHTTQEATAQEPPATPTSRIHENVIAPVRDHDPISSILRSQVLCHHATSVDQKPVRAGLKRHPLHERSRSDHITTSTSQSRALHGTKDQNNVNVYNLGNGSLRAIFGNNDYFRLNLRSGEADDSIVPSRKMRHPELTPAKVSVSSRMLRPSSLLAALPWIALFILTIWTINRPGDGAFGTGGHNDDNWLTRRTQASRDGLREWLDMRPDVVT